MSSAVPTLNLADADDGMVSLRDKPTTAFHTEKNNNITEYKDASMDSTPIMDVMGAPQEMMDSPTGILSQDPRMAQSMMMQPPTVAAPQSSSEKPAVKPNPFNLTDEQMQALVVAVATAIAISKPVQEKLASSVPKFLNGQGSRSMIGLGATGLTAAIIFYFAKRYV